MPYIYLSFSTGSIPVGLCQHIHVFYRKQAVKNFEKQTLSQKAPRFLVLTFIEMPKIMGESSKARSIAWW